MIDKATALKQFEFYAQSAAPLREENASAATPTHLVRGEFFVREGEMCNQFATDQPPP